MTLLLLNQFYAPGPAPTGELLADLARHLAAQGDSVSVVCARAPYAGSNGNAPRDPDGVRVLRTPAFAFSHRRAARLASWLSFYAGALWHALRSDADVVLTLTTPPLLSLAGALAQRLRGARHFIWEMDLYPDVAVAVGVFPPRSWPDRIAGALADLARRRADGVIAIGPCMRDRLMSRGVPGGLIHVVDNWADPAAIAPLPFPPGPYTLLYSGNLGLAHDVETIAAAIEALNGDAGFRFVFAGGGPRRRALEDRCRAAGVSNVFFEGYIEIGELSDHFGACHVGLVTQHPATLGCVVPCKTYALMAAGRPVLFIGPRQATPARIIGRFACGWQIDPGDSAGLVALLAVLADNPNLVREAGRRARHAFLENYTVQLGVARIADVLCGNGKLSQWTR
ncbi:MAG: glycosyltransferase family 4 protein [Acidobacteriota bacterium]